MQGARIKKGYEVCGIRFTEKNKLKETVRGMRQKIKAQVQGVRRRAQGARLKGFFCEE